MYVVAYDISDDRERLRVAKAVVDFGYRVQKSVWVCDMDGRDCARLRRRLEGLKVTSGNIHIWLASGAPVTIGMEVPERPWAHCL